MNIFVLDLNPKKCAIYHCNKHLVKMITEHNQILGSVAYTAREIYRKKDITPEFIASIFQGFPRIKNGQPHPYGIGYSNHPCTQWAGASRDNYQWLCRLNKEMCKEYTRRYERRHAGEDITQWYSMHSPGLSRKGLTPFVQAMPADCKRVDVVEAYRTYYRKYKFKFAKWPDGKIPDWW
jgi:hypothetical protein